MELNIIDYGRMDYFEALELQRKLQRERIEESITDTLMVLEHNPVLTLGKRGEYSNILVSEQLLKDKGIQTVEVERGGDITFHGPGQLVVYPILDLMQHGKDLRRYINNIQDVMINVLKRRFDIDAEKKTGVHTGVWIGNNKIAAMGISVSKWVTMHGFALNVNTDMSYFDMIVPCGLAGFGVTSIEKETGAKADFGNVSKEIQDEFISVFGYDEVTRTTG